MRVESDSSPDEYEIKDGTVVIRNNITAVQRTDDSGKAYTTYQYDEVKVSLDGKTDVSEAYAQAVAKESDSGTATLGKGTRHIIKHRLGSAPEHVNLSGLPAGSIVFTLSNEGLLVILPDGADDVGTVTWNVGTYLAGTKRELSKRVADKISAELASLKEAVE